MAERLLITGGAGFIGSNLVRHVLGHTDAHVVVLDKLTYAGNLASLADVRDEPRFTFVHGDIADQALLDRLFAEHRFGGVLNLAAESHVDRSIDGPRAFLDTNVTGTFELLQASRRHHATLSQSDKDCFRFLHVSTDEVYGSLGPEGLFTESTPYAPNSPYAATKAAADHLVRAWHETFGLPTLLTNCSNNYGPYQYPEKLIPLMTLNALDGEPLPIYGDGGNVRDWLFVDDHCAAILLVLRRGRVGERYNVGGHGERSNIEVVDALCAALERVSPAADSTTLRARGLGSYRELRTFVADRPGHDRRYAMDASRITAELGWCPTVSFESGIESTVRWYAQNRAWCQAVQGQGKYARERLGLERKLDVGPRKV